MTAREDAARILGHLGGELAADADLHTVSAAVGAVAHAVLALVDVVERADEATREPVDVVPPPPSPFVPLEGRTPPPGTRRVHHPDSGPTGLTVHWDVGGGGDDIACGALSGYVNADVAEVTCRGCLAVAVVVADRDRYAARVHAVEVELDGWKVSDRATAELRDSVRRALRSVS